MHGNEWFTTQNDTENMLKLQWKNMCLLRQKLHIHKNDQNVAKIISKQSYKKMTKFI